MSDSTVQTTTIREAAPASLTRAGALAILLGLGLVWGVGFAAPAAIHNAAHDARHSLAFPCH